LVFDGLPVAALVCALFLAACQNDLYEGSTAPDEYWISTGPQGGTNSAIDRLTSEAAQLCPGGYHKFSEQIESKMLRWGIHCGDTFGDDSVAQ
jgi:hypothetical protein